MLPILWYFSKRLSRVYMCISLWKYVFQQTGKWWFTIIIIPRKTTNSISGIADKSQKNVSYKKLFSVSSCHAKLLELESWIYLLLISFGSIELLLIVSMYKYRVHYDSNVLRIQKERVQLFTDFILNFSSRWSWLWWICATAYSSLNGLISKIKPVSRSLKSSHIQLRSSFLLGADATTSQAM